MFGQLGVASPSYTETTDGQAFRDAMLEAKKRSKYFAAVTIKDLDEYQSGDYRLFLTEDATGGFALSGEGDIVSVFKDEHRKRFFSMPGRIHFLPGFFVSCVLKRSSTYP